MKKFLLLFILILTSCASFDESVSWTDRSLYTVIQLDDNLFRITMNRFPSEETENLIIFKCADVAIERGFSYFIVEAFSYTSYIIILTDQKPSDKSKLCYDAKLILLSTVSRWKRG